MPNQSEYEQILESAEGGILEMSVDTKAGVMKLVAEARRRVRAERDKLTRGISNRWREQFTTIKRENDEWQKALDAAYHRTLVFIDDEMNDMFEGIQK